MAKINRFILHLLGRIASMVGITRNTLSLRAALRRCRMRGLHVGTIIDVGASDGRWSLEARDYFPHAFCLLFEAQEEHKKSLEKVKSKFSRFDYIIAAAGDRQGSIYFDARDLFGGLASYTPVGDHCRSVPMVTVDEEVIRRNLPPPYLLKLDTHGFELPILSGAKKTLDTCSLVIIEAYNFKLSDNCLRFHELCSFMEKNGFSCIDMVDPMHRPGDRALWQMDLLFVPSDNVVFSSNSYLPREMTN